MLPLPHFIISLGICILLYPFFGLWTLLILAASILIDVDHYMTYVVRSKKVGLNGAYNFFRERFKRGDLSKMLLLFHTIEYFILMGIASFFSDIIMLLFLGSLLHMSLDIIEYLMYVSIDKSHWGRRMSLIFNV